jgi:hypothetical protein
MAPSIWERRSFGIPKRPGTRSPSNRFISEVKIPRGTQIPTGTTTRKDGGNGDASSRRLLSGPLLSRRLAAISVGIPYIPKTGIARRFDNGLNCKSFRQFVRELPKIMLAI